MAGFSSGAAEIPLRRIGRGQHILDAGRTGYPWESTKAFFIIIDFHEGIRSCGRTFNIAADDFQTDGWVEMTQRNHHSISYNAIEEARSFSLHLCSFSLSALNYVNNSLLRNLSPAPVSNPPCWLVVANSDSVLSHNHD